jgi:hypothetical protein
MFVLIYSLYYFLSSILKFIITLKVKRKETNAEKYIFIVDICPKQDYTISIKSICPKRRSDSMPRRDQTGPLGEGPMTGRQAGRCVDANSQGFRGLGFRGQRLRGGRFGNRAYNANRFDTKESLQQEKSFLESRLDEINNTLKES